MLDSFYVPKRYEIKATYTIMDTRLNAKIAQCDMQFDAQALIDLLNKQHSERAERALMPLTSSSTLGSTSELHRASGDLPFTEPIGRNVPLTPASTSYNGTPKLDKTPLRNEHRVK